MKVKKRICIAGKSIITEIKVTSGYHKGKRGPKKNITSEMVQKNNDRLAVLNLTKLLNANFDEDDMHITLTYQDIPSLEEAKKDRKNFIERLKYRMRKQGKELKAICVTEYENKRPHHHIVLNTNDMDMITECWRKGFVHSTQLDESGNYNKLAEYLIKETTRTFRNEDAIHKKRYTRVGRLITPVTTEHDSSYEELIEDPKPIAGYYIPEDCKRRFEHPVTGLEHQEYIQVAKSEPRRFKKWPKGKVVSTREKYKPDYFEEQLDLDELIIF